MINKIGYEWSKHVGWMSRTDIVQYIEWKNS